jgi:hypothetical protein
MSRNAIPLRKEPVRAGAPVVATPMRVKQIRGIASDIARWKRKIDTFGYSKSTVNRIINRKGAYK